MEPMSEMNLTPVGSNATMHQSKSKLAHYWFSLRWEETRQE
jgi:hypothetical protein